VDPLLLAFAIVAFIAAVAFGAFAWRLLRTERDRSAARVAMLASAIDAGTPATPTAAVNNLFAREESAASTGSPLIKAAVAGVMTIILVLAVAWMASGPSDETGTRTQTASSSRTRQAQSAPLELISMRHNRVGANFTITGLVRNPPAGGPVSRVTAVVLAFNNAGAFVASGRAALDFTTLDPGDESPFLVTITGAPDVARYRVSFRTEAGVVRHVDRRADQNRLAAAVHLQ